MIKLIATDMDGTWLNSEKTFDQDLFKRDLKLMQDHHINFVIASGNQYENLKTRFPGYVSQLYFVAENGALIAKGKQILAIDDLSQTDIDVLLTVAQKYHYPIVWAGLTSAYVFESDGPLMYNEMQKYYFKLKAVKSFNQINDRLFKMSFIVPEGNVLPIVDDIRQNFPTLEVVAGSEFSIDISQKGMSKAVGLAKLGKKLGISAREMVAFGDSGNDVEMLKYVGKSFVTATGQSVAKQVADEIIGSSDESSVQKKIIDLLS
ncbi:Cof-type HAD-IIB family hydrolase [Lactobacillus psittaci]|uniref:Phosphatase YbjI n=1 Tax=Lactobacillus psittaci DSM 15354 TaxID=1122152 RepID=A0A0R1SBB9_9LACO|nr:HAD family hydrolase [Lactobacillus psittaci]KRL63352.1 phosphatase YbjI [Lactobacillus psittaci DSM 15354]